MSKNIIRFPALLVEGMKVVVGVGVLVGVEVSIMVLVGEDVGFLRLRHNQRIRRSH